MTEREAIKHLKLCKSSRLFIPNDDVLNMAISALEKQTAKSPLNIQGNPPYGNCPSCGHIVLKHMDVNGCRQCLQRLNWTNLE